MFPFLVFCGVVFFYFFFCLIGFDCFFLVLVLNVFDLESGEFCICRLWVLVLGSFVILNWCDFLAELTLRFE